MKKILSIFLVVILIMPIFTNNIIFAQNNIKKPEEVFRLQNDKDIEEFYKSIDKMNINDLQKIIDYSKTNSESRSSLLNSYQNLKLAWYAAAKIARLRGYPLSATLVEHSLKGKNYYETDGQFARAIKNTSLYKVLLKEGRGEDVFTRSINKDLYYAIKKFSFTTNGGSSGIVLTVSDRFNFEFQKSFKDGTFSTLVNNWGYLNQGIWILKDIEVRINIYAK